MKQIDNKNIHCLGGALVDILMKPIGKYPKPHVRSNVFVEKMNFSPFIIACSLLIAAPIVLALAAIVVSFFFKVGWTVFATLL